MSRAGAPADDVAYVYAHYPYCVRKCPYCDFNSHAGRENEIEAYVDALLLEARTRLEGSGVATLYVGGGTPTHAPARVLERYLSGLREAAGGVAQELTVEANPGSLDAAKVEAMRRAGVDRVSLGAQSFDARHLATLGRIHDAADTIDALRLLRDGGLDRISLDVILAVPDQTLDEQAQDLDQLLALDTDHVSAYVLTYEEGTAFSERARQGRLPGPDGDREIAFLRLAVQRIEAAGLRRYEISNFARPGFESRHNLAYWRDEAWIGLGAGAHSHVGDRRFKNVADPGAYVEAVTQGGTPVTWEETLTPEVALFDALMMGLRLVDGVDLADLAARHGIDPRARYEAELEKHVRLGHLRLDGTRLAATDRGLDVLSGVLLDLLPTQA